MSLFKLRADLLAAVGMFRGQEAARNYLNGVRVVAHNGGALMVATDGHRLALGFDPAGHVPYDATLCLDFKDKSLKHSARGGSPLLEIDLPGEAGSWADGAGNRGILRVTENGGHYPDFWRVLPATGEGATMLGKGWNAAYLADFGAAYRIIGRAKTMLTFSGSLHDGPSWVQGDDPALSFILMPAYAKAKLNEAKRPEWLDVRPQSAAA